MGQLFSAAGIDMGDPEEFYPADNWNPYGYFEQSDIITLDKVLLHGSFGKFSYLLLPSTRTIMKRARSYADDLQAVSAKYQSRAIKSPRFCLTLPAWKEYGGEIERMIICLREPIQVAQSIRRRNRDMIWHGLYLWYTHNKRLSDHIGDIPVWYVRYSHLIDANTCQKELGGALRFFGHNFDDEQISVLAEKRIKPELRHHAQVPPSYAGHIQQLWDKLCARHAAQFE